MPTAPDRHADGEEFDSWLTGKAARPIAEPQADGASSSSYWWTPSVSAVPTDPAQLGSMLWGAALRVKETVSESIDGNLLQLQAERERVLEEARRLKPVHDAAANDAPPPWKVLSEQYQILEEDLRSQMLELSKSHSTFLEPPARSAAHVDHRTLLPTCLAALRDDPQLAQRRFELVPARLDETTFWRNYFDKVFAIKDAILATSIHLNSIGCADPPPRAPPQRAGARSDGGLDAAAPHGAAASGEQLAVAPLAPVDNARADAMAERIRRELELGSELEFETDAPSAPGTHEPSGHREAAGDAAARSEEAGAPRAGDAQEVPLELLADVSAATLQAAPSLPAASVPAAGAPARASAPIASSGRDGDAPPPRASSEALRPPPDDATEDEEEDDGVELDSDDDIDKLLDLGDDDDDDGNS